MLFNMYYISVDECLSSVQNTKIDQNFSYGVHMMLIPCNVIWDIVIIIFRYSQKIGMPKITNIQND